MPDNHSIKTVDIVVSVYNEEDVLPFFFEELIREMKKLPYQFTVIFVNDGSTDNSQRVIQTLSEKYTNNKHISFKIIEFSTNYGHEAAMIAGIDYSGSDLVICMDADLQHPPQYILPIIEKANEGFDIINMLRKVRHDNGFIKNRLSKSFYRLMNKVSDYKFDENSSDFFAVTRNVAEILKTNFRERNRFLRGYIQIIGFNRTNIEFEAPKRIAGSSKYSYRQLVSLAGIALFSFSKKPLYFALTISVFFLIFTTVLSAYSIYMFFWGEKPPSGYTTLILFMSIGFSLLFVLVAIMSLYIGRSIDEIKERPIYLVKNYEKK